MENNFLATNLKKYKQYFLVFLAIIILATVMTRLYSLFQSRNLPKTPPKYDISYFYSNTTEDKWKVYIRWNEKINDTYYAVRQPKEWNVIEIHPRSVIFTPDQLSESKKLPNEYFLIQIKDAKGLGFRDYFKQNYQSYNCEEIITNNGIGCMGFEEESGKKNPVIAALSFEDKIAEIIIVTKDQDNQKINALFPLFVSSFFGGR